MGESHTTALTGQRLEGTLLNGRFFIKRHLGSGGFGSVYLAEQRVFDVPLRQVALKLFHQEMVTPENAARVLNDALILVQLQQEPAHAKVARHLITIYDAGILGERKQQAFVAMEYVDGYRTPSGGIVRTLQGLMRAFRPVPIDLALCWMIQILQPLAWMHTLLHPMMHCDLKPDNVLVCGKDTLKIGDFGLAQMAFNVVGSHAAGGALTYQAPETLLGVFPTPAADVYTLGLMFYEMIAGQNPLAKIGLELRATGRHDEYREAQIQARASGLLQLSEGNHPGVKDHPLLIKMIHRCLKQHASERYETAAMLLRDIEEYLAGRDPCRDQLKPSSPPPSPSPPRLDRLLHEAEELIRVRRLDEARACCKQAQALFPQSGKPYRWIAEIHLAQGQWQEALQVGAQGRVVDADDPDLCDVIAAAYELGGQVQVAAHLRSRCAILRQKARK